MVLSDFGALAPPTHEMDTACFDGERILECCAMVKKGSIEKRRRQMVEAAGPGVTRFRTGDRVVYASQPLGAYCDARNLPAQGGRSRGT